MSVAIEILVILLLLVLNGLLAMSEIAIISSSKARLQSMVQAGRRGARIALDLAEEPSQLLSTVQIGITLVGIFAGVFGGATLGAHLARLFRQIPWLAPFAQEASFAIVVIVITYLSLVIGELVPKRLALTNAEGIAAAVAPPLKRLARLAYPLVELLSFSTDAALRILGKAAKARKEITEEEVKLLIDQATEAGVVLKSEHDMIEGVLDLGEMQASDFMTPRHDVVLLDVRDDFDAAWRKILQSGHTYFPVVDGDLSNVLGLTSIKALARHLSSDQPFDLKQALLPPTFVPETAPALKVLEKLRAQKCRMAFVVDEHGSVEGIVTITDLLEAVVGEFPTPEEEPEIVRRDDGSWLVDGGLSIERFKKLFELESLPGEEDYKTLGGFAMARLGRIPKTGDRFSWSDMRFEVVDMDGHRVDKLLVRKRVTKQSSK